VPLFCVLSDLKQCKVWRKQSYMLEDWSDGLKLGKGTGTAGMPSVSATALLMSPVEVPLSESGFDRNISVHTQLDSSAFNYKSGRGIVFCHLHRSLAKSAGKDFCDGAVVTFE
jgi:hypothetical protein